MTLQKKGNQNSVEEMYKNSRYKDEEKARENDVQEEKKSYAMNRPEGADLSSQKSQHSRKSTRTRNVTR